eukprot:scaffold120181_cov46-Prasinocladus_malaysianus.AAC.2
MAAAESPKGFKAFGVGPLIKHPTVQHYFQLSPALESAPASLLSAADIYPHLVAFIRSSRAASPQEVHPWHGGVGAKRRHNQGCEEMSEPPGSNAAAFIQYLLKSLGVQDLREVAH